MSFTFASGWLKDTDHELIRRVSRRFEDVTGLTMDTAEELQVWDHEIIRKWWIYESYIFLPRKEEVNVEKILTVKDATYAFIERKPGKIVITLLSSLLPRQTKPSIREFYPRDLSACFIFSLSM